LQDDIAPSYAVCDTLYRSLEFKMGGISVSRIAIGQYCSQIAALKSDKIIRPSGVMVWVRPLEDKIILRRMEHLEENM